MAGPHRWIASTPSSWVAASFDTELLPAVNEKVYFDGSGQGDVIGGLNQATIDLDLLQIDEAYEGIIGAYGAPLIISADEVFMRGRGSLFYKDGNGTTDLVIVDSPNLQDAAILDGTSITRLRAIRGRTQLLSTIGIIAKLELEQQSVTPTIVDAGGFSPTVTSLRIAGGELITQGLTGTTNPIQTAGLWRCTGGFSGSPGMTLTGGRTSWEAPSGGGIQLVWAGDWHLIGGVLDVSRGGFKGIDVLYEWGGGQLYDPNGYLSVTTRPRMKP